VNESYRVQASSLDVIKVAVPESGRAKCPYDPTSAYAFVHSGKLFIASFLVCFFCRVIAFIHYQL